MNFPPLQAVPSTAVSLDKPKEKTPWPPLQAGPSAAIVIRKMAEKKLFQALQAVPSATIPIRKPEEKQSFAPVQAAPTSAILIEQAEEKKPQEQNPSIGRLFALHVPNTVTATNAFTVVGPDSTTLPITADCHRSLLRKRENGDRRLLQIQDLSGARICIANTRCLSRTQDINLAQVIVRGTPKEREEAMKLIVAYQADCKARHHAS